MPSTYNLSGHLYNNAGVPIAGAKVNLFKKNTTTPALSSATTDTAGLYTISPGSSQLEQAQVDVRVTNAATGAVRRIKYDDVTAQKAVIVRNVHLSPDVNQASSSAGFHTTLAATALQGDSHTVTFPDRTGFPLVTATTQATGGGITLSSAETITSSGSISTTGALSIASMGGNWTNAGRTVANMGTLTTVDINGGNIDATIIGATTPAAITGEAVTGTSLVGGTVAGTTAAFSGLITANGGITFDDGDSITFTGASTTNNIVLGNALADALSITDGSADIIVINTATGTNTVAITGNLTVSGTIDADTAAVATTVTVTDNESTDEANAIIFTAGGDLDGGNLGLESDGTLNYNPSTGTLTTTTFAGALTGNVTGTADVATVATTVTITDNESTDESNALIFTAGGDVDGGNIGLESDGTLTYNPSTGKVTATGFVGALTGNADTVTTNANLTGDVTSSGNAAAIASNVIVNADVNSSAAIAYSKLAALADGNILVGNGSDVAVSVNPSGDVDVTNAGVFSIASGVIVNADVNASAAIAVSKTALAAGTNISLSTNTLNVDDAFLINSDNDTTTGTITAAGFTASDDTDVILGEAGKVNFADVAPDDGEATGVVLSFIADVTLAVGDLVYIVADGSDGKVGKADANQVTTMPAIGVAVTGVSADAAVEVLVQGLLRRNSAYGFTIGQDLFVSAAAVAGVTATAPSGSGDTVQKVGVALHADIAYYNFNTTEVLLA